MRKPSIAVVTACDWSEMIPIAITKQIPTTEQEITNPMYVYGLGEFAVKLSPHLKVRDGDVPFSTKEMTDEKYG